MALEDLRRHFEVTYREYVDAIQARKRGLEFAIEQGTNLEAFKAYSVATQVESEMRDRYLSAANLLHDALVGKH